jgi:hypothetical protein
MAKPKPETRKPENQKADEDKKRIGYQSGKIPNLNRKGNCTGYGT